MCSSSPPPAVQTPPPPPPPVKPLVSPDAASTGAGTNGQARNITNARKQLRIELNSGAVGGAGVGLGIPK